MTDRDSNNPILYVILLLVVANLAITVAVWDRGTSEPTETETKTELPPYADRVVLAELAARASELFNSGDVGAFYSEFDELARMQFTELDLTIQLSEFANVVGKIENASFSHHESSRYGNYQAYVLHYKVRLIDGPFSTGSMMLSVIDRGDAFGLLGFNIFGGSR